MLIALRQFTAGLITSPFLDDKVRTRQDTLAKDSPYTANEVRPRPGLRRSLCRGLFKLGASRPLGVTRFGVLSRRER